VVVLDNAPSHLSKEITHPENISLLNLPAYSSPELNPVERWFLEFRRALSKTRSSRASSCFSGGAQRGTGSVLARA
jgi:hypothetical protein